MARPEQVAVGLAKMHVCQKLADAGQRRDHVLLLNVHVEAVHHQAETGLCQAPDQGRRLGDRVVKPNLAVVHRLEGDDSADAGGVCPGFVQALGNAGTADIAIRFVLDSR